MTREQISEFCIVSLANVLRIPTETVKADAIFNRLGLDSAMVVYLMMELEEKLDLELSPDDFYDYPTVNDLSRYLPNGMQRAPLLGFCGHEASLPKGHGPLSPRLIRQGQLPWSSDQSM
jgi:acyl carrier protein